MAIDLHDHKNVYEYIDSYTPSSWDEKILCYGVAVARRDDRRPQKAKDHSVEKFRYMQGERLNPKPSCIFGKGHPCDVTYSLGLFNPLSKKLHAFSLPIVSTQNKGPKQTRTVSGQVTYQLEWNDLTLRGFTKSHKGGKGITEEDLVKGVEPLIANVIKNQGMAALNRKDPRQGKTSGELPKEMESHELDVLEKLNGPTGFSSYAERGILADSGVKVTYININFVDDPKVIEIGNAVGAATYIDDAQRKTAKKGTNN